MKKEEWLKQVEDLLDETLEDMAFEDGVRASLMRDSLWQQFKRMADEIETLQGVCAEAYQLAGQVNASEKALDNLSAAANGLPLPHESFLPVEDLAVHDFLQDIGISVYLSYEDARYPTLILQGTGFDTLGYDLDTSSGELKRVCICAAHSENECVCGAWSV
jgi:hypothetical protein